MNTAQSPTEVETAMQEMPLSPTSPIALKISPSDHAHSNPRPSPRTKPHLPQRPVPVHPHSEVHQHPTVTTAGYQAHQVALYQVTDCIQVSILLPSFPWQWVKNPKAWSKIHKTLNNVEESSSVMCNYSVVKLPPPKSSFIRQTPAVLPFHQFPTWGGFANLPQYGSSVAFSSCAV